MKSARIEAKPTELSYLYPIIGSQIQRVGFLRVLVGAGSMYLCIPILVFIHFTLTVLLYQWLLRPLFGLPRVRWADHVIIDRHRIAGLPLIDKINCVFCGYANGLTTMINMELDQLARHTGKVAWLKGVSLWLVVIPVMPFISVMSAVGMRGIYDTLVSRPLGMHRTSRRETAKMLADADYAGSFNPIARFLIRDVKNAFVRFSLALEQIESSWCPLKHFETRKGVVYPKHHEKFFGPHQIEEMRRVLVTVGTVSDRRPTAGHRA